MIILSVSRMELFDQAARLRRESTEVLLDYWTKYTLYTSFEFWIVVAIFLIPLVILIFKIDKKNIFLIGFYGYSVHIFTFYMTLFGINMGYWNYPIQMIPQIPSIAFDASFTPVTFMLAYQWTVKNKKNYYIVALVLSGLFAFIMEPTLVKMGIFKMYGDINHIHRFIVFVVATFIAKFITNVFIWLHQKHQKPRA